MKNLLLPNDSTANKISYCLIALLLLSLPFDRFFSHLILLVFTLHTLINLQKKDLKGLFSLSNLLLSGVFFVTLFSTFYSTNQSQGFTEIGRQIPILLVPFLFFVNPIDLKKYRNHMLLTFAIGCTLTTLYLYFQAFLVIRYYHFPASALFTSAFTNHNFAEPLGIHATYFSMLLVMALIYLISVVISSTTTTLNKVITLIGCVILTAGIIQLSSKSIFIALFLIINFAVPYFLFTGKNRLRIILIFSSLTIVALVGIYQIDSLKERYFDELKKDLNANSTDKLTDPRIARWKLGLQLVEESPIIGHGAGTETELLKTTYFQHQLYRSYLASLNAHNQLLSFLIKSGIWGLFIYLSTLFFGIKLAFKSEDLYLCAFVILISVVSFSENILSVDKGIIFYSLFFGLLYYSNPLANKGNRTNKLFV